MGSIFTCKSSHIPLFMKGIFAHLQTNNWDWMGVVLERSAVGILIIKYRQCCGSTNINYEMLVHLHLLFYCVRFFGLTRCVANTVITFAMSSILNLHFSLLVILLLLSCLVVF